MLSRGESKWIVSYKRRNYIFLLRLLLLGYPLPLATPGSEGCLSLSGGQCLFFFIRAPFPAVTIAAWYSGISNLLFTHCPG